MKWIIFLVSLSSLSLVTGCSKVKPATTHSHTQNSTEAQLGSLQQCQQYSGLPEAWQNSKTAGWSGFLKVHFNWVQIWPTLMS
jgi:hypothetical protein